MSLCLSVWLPHPDEQTLLSSGGNPIIGFVVALEILVITSLVLIIIIVIAVLSIRYAKKRTLSRTNTLSLQNLSDMQDPPFQLVHLISQGRFGYVYRTQYEGDLVAVKVFSYHNRQSWENERTLFSMESTKHQNIIEYVVSGSWGTGYQLQMFIVSPYYPLGSLNRFLARNTVSWEQACRVIHSVASGLSHLHSESYINSSGVGMEKYCVAHRDLKSPNVLVRGENGDSVIADLGFALILDPACDEKDMANAGQVWCFF